MPGKRLRAGPLHHALIGAAQALARTPDLIWVEIELREYGGVGAVDRRHFVKTEIERRTHVARVPLADVAKTIARVAQALRVEYDIGIKIAMHRGR